MQRPPLYLFLFLFAFYLLTYAPTFHSSDGLAMFSTAESLVRRGAWDIEQIRWMDLQQGTYGLDGRLYSRKGIGQPLLALPLTWLGLTIPWFGPVTVTLLFGSLITALISVLIFIILNKLGYNDRASLITALLYGTATLAWPYAKTFFSDPLAGFLLLAATLALLTFKQTGRNRYAFLAGLSLAWAIATRYAEGIFLPIFGLLFLAYLKPKSQSQNLKRLISPMLAFGLPIALVGLGLMRFNLARYGDPLNTGYLAEETFSAIWWQGILGQLLSPGRGLFLYSPILLISFLGFKSFWQTHRLEALTCLAVILVHLLLYGKWFMWHGGFAWGPRFMVPTLPFWALLMAPALARLSPIQPIQPNQTGKPTKHPSPVWRRGFYSLWAISVLVQIPGLAVDFALWQNYLVTTGLPLYAPITFLLPRYSPLFGAWSLMTPANLDLAWVSQGQIAWPISALLLINLLLITWLLCKNFFSQKSLRFFEAAGDGEQVSNSGQKQPIISKIQGLIPLALTALTTFVLLQHVHQAPPGDLTKAIRQINQAPEPLIYNNPEQALFIAEHYQGRTQTLGIIALDQAHLDAFTAQTSALWWLPTHQHDIETHLMATYGRARNESYGAQRLVLFVKPDSTQQAIQQHFVDAITLQSVRFSANFQPNSPFAVEFTWQAFQVPSTDYTIFIHLTNAAGETVSQADGQPVHWTRPTTTWQPGETITDLHALWLPDLPPDDYTLITGLYQPASGERLLTESGENFIALGSFSLRP